MIPYNELRLFPNSAYKYTFHDGYSFVTFLEINYFQFRDKTDPGRK